MPSPNPHEPSDPVDAAIRAAHKVRRLSRDEIVNTLSPAQLAHMIDRIGGSMWVVVSSDGRSVLQDPALKQPFHHNNRKFAESIAKETGGVAMTWTEALKVITDRNKPND